MFDRWRRRGAVATLAIAALAGGLLYSHAHSVDAASVAPAPPIEAASRPVERPPLAGDMVWLEQEMTRAIEQYWVPGDYAVSVTDLQTGETASVNGDRLQLSGCLVNLFALYQAVKDVWSSKYSQETVEQLIADTIWGSNAVTAHELYGIIGDGDTTEGVRRVDQLIHGDLHLDGVILDHPPAFDESIGVSPDNWASVNAMNDALAVLWHGQLVPDPSWRDFLLGHMTAVKPGLQYLTAAVPEVVSHKNGFLWTSYGYVDNDAGIVRLQRDGTEYAYAITFMSQGVEEEYADIPLGQELGNLAYLVMSERYP